MAIGIIGGSGLYNIEKVYDVHAQRVGTPFGEPSDEFIRARYFGQEVIFLPRHGKGHTLLPSEINHRANIYGFKVLGAEAVISISAVGSLKAGYRPRDLVLPDQYFDRTKRSEDHTFFGRGIVAHVGFGEPSCPGLRRLLADAARRVIRTHPDRETRKRRVVDGGTYVNMEGPAFSTKAESRTYRQMGFDVIGMTSLAEAKLCREAEMCYQAVAMVTDYDCWHESESPVTVDMIIGHLTANTTLAQAILREAMSALPQAARECECRNALANAIVTRAESVPPAIKKQLAPIIGRYMR